MSESATELAGPSLEDILWRAMDRFAEEPAVLDAEEFAARIAGAFDGELPEEAFVERFVEGNPELARKADMAEAIVRSTPTRLSVYQFDLDHLDYVVIEEEEQVIVVSDFGQFALTNDRPAQQAIASAVARARGALGRRAVDRAWSEPRPTWSARTETWSSSTCRSSPRPSRASRSSRCPRPPWAARRSASFPSSRACAASPPAARSGRCARTTGACRCPSRRARAPRASTTAPSPRSEEHTSEL